MKIFILVLLVTAQTHAGWFSRFDDDRLVAQYEQQLASERQASGGWEILAGVLAIGAVVLFAVGTALGSKTKRDGKR